MSPRSESPFACACGRTHSPESPAALTGTRAEFACRCGREYDLELREGGWAHSSDPLTPEERQPLTSFSAELKAYDDCQRYYFSHRVTGGIKVPVHLVFSPSAARAEITTGGMKPFRMEEVASAVQARRRWIEWFDSLGAERRRRMKGTPSDYPAGKPPELQ